MSLKYCYLSITQKQQELYLKTGKRLYLVSIQNFLERDLTQPLKFNDPIS